MDQLGAELARRGIRLVFCETAAAARDTVLGLIPPGATVMTGTSLTLDQLGITERLREGRYRYLRDEVRATDDPEARFDKRRLALTADYFLGGINALAATGEIVNVDSSGSRIAGYAYAGRRVIMVAGLNKVVPTLADALERIRVVAAVQEARRVGRRPPCLDDGLCHNYDCYPPERQCGKILIIEKEQVPGRTTVVLVGESLGY
ncbi:MAG TPA: lactate utilization protein [Thermodesulfobacteriota bacterium]|nr:lactate utilization protein [Thermodesulfobacteriota bacterium]